MSGLDSLPYGDITGDDVSAAAKQVVPPTTHSYPIGTIAVCNHGSGTIYLGGDEDVDASNGFPLVEDATIAIDIQDAGMIWAFLTNTQDLRWLVTSK